MKRNVWHRRLACLAVSGLLAAAAIIPSAAIHAAVPDEISYQAYLTDSAGFPITSPSVDVTIDIYDLSAGGTALVSQVFPGLDLSASQGFINLNVDTSGLTDSQLNATLWVEITINAGGGPETLAPRQKIVSAPQALNSDLLDGLDSTALVDLASVQTVAGLKTFANNVIITVGNVNTSVSGETGAGLSVLAANDPAAWRSVGARSRVLQSGAEPGGAPPAGLTNRQIQGVVGSVSGQGGSNTTLGGGYFNAKLLSTATNGAVQVTGVSADGEVETGATMLPGQLILGGRFGANMTNAGVGAGVGVVGTSLATGGHLGPSSGVVGVGAGSASQNAGVVGAANVDPTVLPTLLSTTAQGVGVYGFNNFPGGVAIKADNGGSGNTALQVVGPSTMNGNVAVTGVVTSTVSPTNPDHLTRKDYVDAAVAAVSGGSGPYVDLTTAQTIAGVKTFTSNTILNLTNVNTNTSGESGAGWSLLATPDPAANRAIGARSRVLASAAEPVGGRLIQGMVGSGQASGGAGTRVEGGYFQGKVTSGATAGASAVTGVAGEASVEAGASGFSTGQAMFGGRFNVDANNSGDASAVGAVGLAAGTHTGGSAGLVGVGRESTTSNVGVLGAANASDFQVGILSTVIPATGVGVYAYNPNAAGTALVADSTGGTAISANGNVSITGKATQSVLTPTDPGDLATKSYVDSTVQGTFTRTLFVVPTGGAATPDGSLSAPFGTVNDAYATAKTMSPSYFNRVAIVVLPGQHTITSTLNMDTAGIDLIGFGYRSATIQGTVDPLITMTATTSGATIENLRISPSGAANVGVAAQAGGRLANVLLQRPAGAGTLLTIANAVVAGQSLSISDFEIYGNVSITNYGTQTTFTRGFVSGTITSTSTSPSASEFLALININSIGGISFTPASPGILLMNNCPQVLAVSINSNTVIRGNSVGFMTAAGAPLALSDPLTGSLLANSTADVTAWTATVASTGNLAAVGYVAAIAK